MTLPLQRPALEGSARRLRSTPGHADTLLIALTGWGQEQDVRRSRAAGFNHHLVKPPDIDRLRDLLRAG